jgi:uncharacterized protein (TIGR03435 family)
LKKLLLWMIALAALPGAALQAQPVTGSWQGTLKAGQDLRIVIKISLEDDNLKATLYSIDQPAPGIPASAITKDGLSIKMTVAAINGSYEGKLSGDGKSIVGTWNQGAPLPLTLVRATPETAWTIPEPPPPPKVMPAEAKPVFEVATIKPSNPATPGFSILVGRRGAPANSLTTTNTTLNDLIKFAYGLHPRQIVGGPGWSESDKFDVMGKPDLDGIPNVEQLKMMMQKLLAERFQLTFHHEKKDLSVYAITVVKAGIKMTKEEGNPNGLPGFMGGGVRGLNVRNATMAEFASMLQASTLDQPVVDQTGLGSARYNFILKWTPDGPQPQLGGAGPNAPPPADNADAPPDLFTAFQQQLGLKLESTKAPVDVLVIDKVEKPSDN